MKYRFYIINFSVAVQESAFTNAYKQFIQRICIHTHMNKISKDKCNSFRSHLRRYQQKSHLNYEEMSHLLYLTSYHNFYESYTPEISPFQMWTKEFQTPIETKPEKQYVQIDMQLTNVSDILSLLEKHPLKPNVEYSVNLEMLNKIRPELEQLNAMVGMKTLKSAILDQLIYYIQGFDGSQGFKHTVLYGPPGTGKTEIAKIMGNMYSKLGVIKKPTPDQISTAKTTPASEALSALLSCKPAPSVGTTAFKKITRADLVAGYVGQTALKTKALINECLGGVIFLDEAYSLGGKDDGDTFSKECVDTLCESLSNYKENLMFIIAGYEKELKSNFFNMNPGLESRFVWRFKIDDYSYSDLWDIFKLMVHKDQQWKIDAELEKCGKQWFQTHFSKFPCFGRDVETFLFKTKIAHSRRVYGLSSECKGVLTTADMNAGLAKFYNEDKALEKKEQQRLLYSLYA